MDQQTDDRTDGIIELDGGGIIKIDSYDPKNDPSTCGNLHGYRGFGNVDAFLRLGGTRLRWLRR